MSRRRRGLLVVAVLPFFAAALFFAHGEKLTRDYRKLDAELSASPTPLAADALSLRWYGTTATLIQHGEDAVMVDPFFTRPPGLLNLVLNRPIAPDEAAIAAALAEAGINRLHAVMVSHSHFDHAMDAGVVARLTGAKLIGSESTLNIGRGAGVPESQLVIASIAPVTAGPYALHFIRSRHAGGTGGHPIGDILQPLQTPARYLDYKQGGTYSIHIQHPQGSVLHHGSAGFVKGALRGLRADTAAIGVAVVDDREAYLREVVDVVGARRVVMMHWDDFTRPLDAPLRVMPIGVALPGFIAHARSTRPQLDWHLPRPGLALPVAAP